MRQIQCCRDCVPPRRHFKCHGSCPDYAQEKAAGEMEKAQVVAKQAVNDYFVTQRARNIRTKLEKDKRAR